MSISKEDLAYLSYLIYNKKDDPRKIEKGGPPILDAPSGTQYDILDYFEDQSGYAGAILKDSFNNIILVHRGTEFDTDPIRDLVITDALAMGIAKINNQIPAAEALLREAQAFAADSGGSLTMTGHSLGGSITQILAGQYQVSGITFNAFGAVGIDDTPSGGEGLVTNYMRATDIVAGLGTHFGDVVKYAAPVDMRALVDNWEEIIKFHTHDITQFFGQDAIMTPGNADRYEAGKDGYDAFANSLVFAVGLIRGGIYSAQPLSSWPLLGWMRKSYIENATVEVFRGDGEADSFSGTTIRDFIVGGDNADQLSGGDGDDYINGNDGNDTLRGDAASDTLFGEIGDDYLDGGSGSDYLYGGTGHDRYNFSIADFQSSPGSADTVVDADGAGQIEIDNVALSIGDRTSETTWESLDGQFTIMTTAGLGEPQTLAIQHIETGATILVQNWTRRRYPGWGEWGRFDPWRKR